MNLRTIAILRGFAPGQSVELAERAWGAGFDLVEVPVQDQSGWTALEALASAASGRRFGAGTVLTPDAVLRAKELGATVCVSPGINLEVIGAALNSGIVPLPGVLSPSEVMVAHGAGVRLCKLFPASALGPLYLRSLGGPFPQMGFIAVGGIDLSNARSFLEAGAQGVAFGNGIDGILAMRDPRAFVDELHEAIVARYNSG